MILTGQEIQNNVINKKITIEPFNSEQLNPNSYNFRLGETIKVYKYFNLDSKKKNEVEIVQIPNTGLMLTSRILYLGHTAEIMGSNHFVPVIRGRSSTGRIGLFLNITADLVDIGCISQWTLQMHVVQPVIIYPGMLIGQVTFWHPKGKISLYNGKYQGNMGPMESKIYQDFS